MRPFVRLHVRFVVAALALAVAGLGLTACVAPGATMRHAMSADVSAGSQRNMHGRMAKLVGAWHVETTVVNQGTTFPALLTFTSDGIVLADETPSPFETTGHGAWAATGPDSADFTFMALVGSEEGPLSATIKVVGSLQYDAGADTWNGPFKVRVVGADGAELLVDDGTFDATRIKVESLDASAEAPEAGGTVPAPAAAAAGLQQPETVFDAFTAAVNAHDVDTALSFFADDAIVELPDEPPPNVFTGAAEIRSWLDRIAQDNIHVEIADAQTVSGTVSATATVDVDSLPPDLVLAGTVEVAVKGGKIASFIYTLDDDTLEKLGALGAGPVEYVSKIDTSAQQIEIPVSLAVDGQSNVYITDGSDTPRVLKYDSQGNFVTAWGEQGSGEGQFQFFPPTPDAGPIGGFVAADAQGNVYVSDAFNARVQKFDADGNFLMQFGAKGTGDGQFDPPGAGPIYVDDEGNIYVSTFPRVQKFDADGNFLAAYGTEGTGDGEFTGAALGTTDDDGNMYVADLVNARVQKLGPDGQFLLKWGSAGTGPGQFYLPVAIVQDSAGKLYVADNTGRIQVFDTEGNYLAEWSETGDGNPPLEGEISGLAIDAQENIYVANFASPGIYVFRPR